MSLVVFIVKYLGSFKGEKVGDLAFTVFQEEIIHKIDLMEHL